MSEAEGTGGLKFLKAIVWVVYAVATAACIVLAFAFFLLLFGANVQAGFSAFIYRWADLFAGPFKGMIPPAPLGNGGIVAWGLLFAIAAYAVVAWLVGMVLNSISHRIYRKSHPKPAPVAAVTPVAAPQPEAPVAPVPEPPAPVAEEPVAEEPATPVEVTEEPVAEADVEEPAEEPVAKADVEEPAEEPRDTGEAG